MPSKRGLTIAAVLYSALFGGAHYISTPPTTSGDCGGSPKSRWDKKVLVDDDVNKIDIHPKYESIEQLNHEQVPLLKQSVDVPRLDREYQVVTVRNCFIVGAKKEADQDIHLILEDAKKNRMVAEIPCPTCTQAMHSDWVKDFRSARNDYIRYRNKFEDFTFDVTGVRFVDQEHTGTKPEGDGPNNVELHPVLKIEVDRPINH